MAGLDPAIHDSSSAVAPKTWIPGTRLGMTRRVLDPLNPRLFGESGPIMTDADSVVTMLLLNLPP
jgi:hypothetical protein